MAEHRAPTLIRSILNGDVSLFNPSTRRAIRTGIDVALGFLAVVAVIVPSLHEFGISVTGEAKVLALVVAATAVISKVKNKLEDLGFLPKVLKSDPDAVQDH